MIEVTSRDKISRFLTRTWIDKEKRIVIKSFDNIIKLNRYKKILEYLYDKGFPVNKVLEVDKKNLILKLEYIDGIPASEWIKNSKKDEEEIKKILDSLANQIFRLHNTVKAKLLVPFSVYYKKRFEKTLESLKNKDKVAYRFFKQILDEINWNSYYVSLVHGDLSLSNILINDNLEVVGILDWECAEYSDPLYDIAIFEGLNTYLSNSLREYFVKKYLNLAGEDYRTYHQYKIIYQSIRILEGFGDEVKRKHVEKAINMIERDRNIDIPTIIRKADTDR